MLRRNRAVLRNLAGRFEYEHLTVFEQRGPSGPVPAEAESSAKQGRGEAMCIPRPEPEV